MEQGPVGVRRLRTAGGNRQHLTVRAGLHQPDGRVLPDHAVAVRDGRIVAVLDWELSTLGHPLADFSYQTMMYRMPPTIVPGLAEADLAVLNAELEKEVAALDTAFDAQAEELEELVVRAKATDVHVPMVALAWMPYAPDSKGRMRPAWD